MAAAMVRFPSVISGIPDDDELPRPYKCPMCEKAFHRLEHQTRHIRTHTGEKPHECSFPGCSKKFSRSDELTRHSRIHNNPNSRRSKQIHTITTAAAYMHDQQTPKMMMPPPRIISQSAPASKVGSPNVSPPNSFSPYNGVSMPSMLSPHARSNGGSPSGQTHNDHDINLLATAASQVAREDQRTHQPVPVARHHHYHHHHHHPYYIQSGGAASQRLPSLSQYAYSQSMSRSHSHEEEHRFKRSRPNSPLSTAPSSPTCSLDSLSPTPEYTPLATPAQSPRIRPMLHDIHLPGIRHLTLHANHQALAPMEPQPDGSSTFGSLSNNNQSSNYISNGGSRISEIMHRPDAHRKLPVPNIPKVAVQDMLNPGHGEYGGSGRSSSSAITASGDLAERY